MCHGHSWFESDPRHAVGPHSKNECARLASAFTPAPTANFREGGLTGFGNRLQDPGKDASLPRRGNRHPSSAGRLWEDDGMREMFGVLSRALAGVALTVGLAAGS